MQVPNDIRYIDNSGWNDYVFRQNKNPNDFSDKAYKRINFVCHTFTDMMISSIKKRMKQEKHIFIFPDIFTNQYNYSTPGVPQEKVCIDLRT